MAHANIDERRDFVKRFLDTHAKPTSRELQSIADQFGCTVAAIYYDIRAIRGVKNVGARKPLHKRIYARDKGICQYCGQPAGDNWNIDHIVPRSIGGPDEPFNLTTACQSCNYQKGPTVWIPRNLDTITAKHLHWRTVITDSAVPEPEWQNRRKGRPVTLADPCQMNVTLTGYHRKLLQEICGKVEVSPSEAIRTAIENYHRQVGNGWK